MTNWSLMNHRLQGITLKVLNESVVVSNSVGEVI